MIILLELTASDRIRLALLIHLANVLLSWLNSPDLTPLKIPNVFVGVAVFIIVNLGFVLRYILVYVFFWLIVVGVQKKSLNGSVIAWIVICHGVLILPKVISLYFPSFIEVDSHNQIPFVMTSVGYYFRGHISSEWILRALSALECFSVITNIALGLHLSALSGISRLRSTLIMVMLELGVTLVFGRLERAIG